MKSEKGEWAELSDDELQSKNQHWWSENPMQYDWDEEIDAQVGSPEFFEKIDQRFLEASPFYAGDPPFEQLIPFDHVEGSDVLEIGCGQGTHAEILAKAGANLTAIDLTERSVDLTKRRLTLADLSADVHQMDAEDLSFADDSFDFIWSWGVIHHSSSPSRILQEVRRVLRPGGEFRMMVYNRKSTKALFCCIKGFNDLLRGKSVDDVLNDSADGYVARFYTRNELADLLESARLSNPEIYVLGAPVQLVPLPASSLKDAIVERIPNWVARPVLRRIGGFLFAVAGPVE